MSGSVHVVKAREIVRPRSRYGKTRCSGLTTSRARPPVDRLHPHQAHEPPDPLPARGNALAAQMPQQLPAPVERIRHVSSMRRMSARSSALSPFGR